MKMLQTTCTVPIPSPPKSQHLAETTACISEAYRLCPRLQPCSAAVQVLQPRADQVYLPSASVGLQDTGPQQKRTEDGSFAPHRDQSGPESHGGHGTDKEVSLKPLTTANPPRVHGRKTSCFLRTGEDQRCANHGQGTHQDPQSP